MYFSKIVRLNWKQLFEHDVFKKCLTISVVGGLIWFNMVNIMVADVLASCVQVISTHVIDYVE